MLTSIDTTEEMINSMYEAEYGKLRRWRINYNNEQGFSNLEGCIYLPADIDPYPFLDKLEQELQELFRINSEKHTHSNS